VSQQRPAAFLDRDGTIIHDAEYLRDPHDVRLLPGAARTIARLNASGVPVVVVTNQSGIARGLLTADDYERVRTRLDETLRAEGARIDATYHCPHHPDVSGPCDCRKPGALLHRRAASDLGLDLAQSLYVGDRWRDVAPALELRGRGMLARSPATPPDELRRADATAGIEVVESLSQGVDRILAEILADRSPPVSQP